jgi:carbon monoxide dehydrogenase subunit G
MKLEGSYTFEAPRDEVWQALLDPEVLAKVMPGCEKLEETGKDQYKAAMKIKVGPVQGQFQGSIKLTDIREPESYEMEVEGKGPAGFMKGKGSVHLEDQGASTVMHYGGEAQVGGRIASVGQRLLDSSAKALTRQSLDGLHEQIKARRQPSNSGGDDASGGDDEAEAVEAESKPPGQQAQAVEVKTPSELEFALGVGKHMLDDLLPAERRPILIGAGLGILALVLFLNWWSSLIARKVANEIWERR